MGSHIDLVSIITGSVVVGLVLLLTLPATYLIAQKLRLPGCKAYADYRSIPEDQDGNSTDESVLAYSITIQKFIIYASTFIGFSTSLVGAVFSTIHPSSMSYATEECWAEFAVFVFETLTYYTILLLASFHLHSNSLLGSAYPSRPVSVAREELHSPFPLSFLRNGGLFIAVGFPKLQTILSAIQLIVSAALFCAYISLPRRPDVFIGEKLVDRQYTGSMISRMTFGWPKHLISFISKKPNVEIEDLPLMDHYTRSESLLEQFASSDRPKLWRHLLYMHYPILIEQWGLSALESVLTFLPQVSIYFILRSLERRQAGEDIGYDAWFSTLALGVGLLLSTWADTWKDWIGNAKLALRVEAQLSAAIFAKAMRKRDVKGVEKSMIEDDDDEDSDDDMSTVPGMEEDSGDARRTYQWTINLIGIDSQRVGQFAEFTDVFLQFPMNTYFSKRYTEIQDQLMTARDEKTGVVSEALQGLRQIKFAALESEWQRKIMKMREKELGAVWQACKYDVAMIFLWELVPTLMTTAALAVYAVVEGRLTPSVAFASLEVFSELEMSLALIPEIITDILDGLISLRRIETYLRSPEKDEYREHSDTVIFQDARVAWPSDGNNEGNGDGRFTLKNINITFPEGKLSVVCGPTGSGKSLLLASILGEADKLSGVIGVPKYSPTPSNPGDAVETDSWIISSSVAFVAQTPWIENGTLRDNIIFGLPFSSVRYRKVVDACALSEDFRILVDGDLTEIGPRGINLSGGQRWRVSLARALYSRAGILVMDDIFSAVDVHVGRQIFEQALTGEFGEGRTRILATHHISLCLPNTDYLVLLGDGVMKLSGAPGELENTESFQQLHQALSRTKSSKSEETSQQRSSSRRGSYSETPHHHRSSSRRGSWNEAHAHKAAPKVLWKQIEGQKGSAFVQPEGRVTGSVRWNVYADYLKSSGGAIFWIAVIIFLFGSEAMSLGRSWWLKIWTQAPSTESVVTFVSKYVQVQDPIIESPKPLLEIADQSVWFYLGIYLAISLAMAISRSSSHLFIWTGSLRASKSLFEQMTARVLRTPLRWVDTVPVGRVINRFTADFATFDSELGDDLGYLFLHVLDLLTIAVAAILVSSYILLLTVALGGACAYFAIQYMVTARELRRLVSQARSPIIEQFSTTLHGIGTIRAFGKSDVYINRMYRTVDHHTAAEFYITLFNKWMTFRTGMADAVFGVLLTAILVSMKNVEPALVGFALSFMLDGANLIKAGIDKYTHTELAMNSTERILEYTQLTVEPAGGKDAPAAWPTEGRLEVIDIVARYSPELPPVLKGLSFHVEPNHRVGVVGRTGSGKSSLTLALFRLLEIDEGSIFIDKVDISSIKLHDLRSRLSIIPQDPVLFSGTIRSNLDPFNEYTEDELQTALKRVHFPTIEDRGGDDNSEDGESGSDDDDDEDDEDDSGGDDDDYDSESGTENGSRSPYNLNAGISEGGLNLSQGQRQLLCLARAIVSRPKIMVLDEATSAVDMQTDTLIQRSIREEFHSSTLIVVAHRLSTVIDFDRILVLADGNAAEYGPPRELMTNKGVFWRMVRESGERRELEEVLSRTTSRF
ncbi:hypothetical protein FQN57_001998 [Myotisia sp. PD_48]|nr:hypothetical protein FQN57_001998 [Myotisia sp. PD_48]